MAGQRPVREMRLEVGQFSHPGRRRSNNEDWLGAFQPEDPERLSKKGSLFLVADGMGGHQGGEMASRRAVDHVIRAYVDDPATDVTTSLRRAIELANAALYAGAADKGGQQGWGTTLVAAVVRDGRLWIANVGDSRAYLLSNGKLSQLSRDHSLVSSMEDAALAGEWIGRHIITRALGRKPEIEVDLFPPMRLLVGDRVLLCSDGLTTPLSDVQIGDIAARYPSQKAAEMLVAAANDRGGPDNVSVILIRVASQSAAMSWLAPVSLLATLTQPETWQRMAADMAAVLRQALPGGDRGVRSPVFIAIALLIVLALIALGFVLGLAFFSAP
jgi:serine/threonine protein phosphatase PrpC